MDPCDEPEDVLKIRKEIIELREEINGLYTKLDEKERHLQELEKQVADAKIDKLSTLDIEVYSRQLIMPDFGVKGQLKLKNAAVLVVGMGGLGCPAAQYLVAAGCGRVGLVDYDVVDRSNLHRQTLHRTYRLDMPKVESARMALRETNSDCRIDVFNTMLDSTNAMPLIEAFDVILDCTDNVATRYLLNDACVLANKPLISGSALQMDGQLTVYHYGANGPCYRCLFPVPPPPESVTNCGDGGVLGAVTGVIGSLQALEAIKLLTGVGDVLSGRLLCFDGTTSQFRTIKLRTRRVNCDVCSESPIVTQLIDYVEFCSMRPSDREQHLTLLPIECRIDVNALNEMYMNEQPMLMIDVRPPNEFEICQLPKSINVPLKYILNDAYMERFKTELDDATLPVVVVCRRGNDSQIAVEHMRNKFLQRKIVDVIGGLRAYHNDIDQDFPIY